MRRARSFILTESGIELGSVLRPDGSAAERRAAYLASVCSRLRAEPCYATAATRDRAPKPRTLPRQNADGWGG